MKIMALEGYLCFLYYTLPLLKSLHNNHLGLQNLIVYNILHPA